MAIVRTTDWPMPTSTATRLIAFDMAIMVWIIPFRKVVAPHDSSPTLISQQVAVRLLRDLLTNVRELANEPKRIARAM